MQFSDLAGGRTVIFIRNEGWYPVVFTSRCKVEDHVKLNPGTVRVEEMDGRVIWPLN
jgi:hypothetical protein